MKSDRHPDDDVLTPLGRVVSRVDPVPEAVVAAARASLAWRGIDSELAELVYDSALDLQPVGLRSASPTRQLTFESSELTVEVELRTSPRRLVGQLIPPQPATVDVRNAHSTVQVEADELGRFVVDSLPEGPVSLRCSRPEADPPRATATAWVSL